VAAAKFEDVHSTGTPRCGSYRSGFENGTHDVLDEIVFEWKARNVSVKEWRLRQA
jgi:hypothetical protein